MLPLLRPKRTDDDDDDAGAAVVVVVTSCASAARRLLLLAPPVVFDEAAEEEEAVGTLISMLNGTSRRSICVLSMSGLALPIEAAAAIDWRSVESGGTAAASARSRKVEPRKPAVMIGTRKPEGFT